MKNIFFIFAMMLLVSCGGAKKDIKVTSFNGFKLEKLTKDGVKGSVDLGVVSGFSKITIKDADVSIYSEKSDKPLIVLTIEDDVVISKKESQVVVPINLKIKGGALGSLLIVNVLKNQRENLYISFSGTFKKGVASKKISIEKIALKDALKRLNLDDTFINKLFLTL